MEDADKLIRRGREESADLKLADDIRNFVDGSEDRIREGLGRLQEPVETTLRRKLHLLGPKAAPLDSIVSSQSSEDRLRQVRRRLKGSD